MKRPADTESAGHELLLRAGFVRRLASGIFSYLPLARRSLDKIQDIMREEIDAIGGQEVTMPVVHSADVWRQTGRRYEVRAEMGRFQDRSGRDMALAMTHEEVVADLARGEIRRDPVLQAASRPSLPHTDQVARRPAAAGGLDPNARVVTRRGWTSSTERTTERISTSSTVARCPRSRSILTSA